MVVNQPLLPPSGRDFEVFRRVRVDQWSTRAAADEAKISQTRVRQIVDRVEVFLNEATSEEENEAVRWKRVWLAEQIASERVNLLFGRMLRAFEAEKFGQPKYAMAAGRLALFGAKLPMSCIGYGTFEDEEEEQEIEPVEKKQPVVVIEVPAADASVQVAPPVNHPPVGDCSDAASKTPVTAEVPATIVAASPDDKDASEDDYRLAAKLKLPSQRPAQQATLLGKPAVAHANSDGLGSPSYGNFSQQPPSGKKLNRKQRRARMQFLKAEG